jgi:hypothetical protein
MNDDLAKLHAGHLGVHAILANVLIDKGIVSREELCQRMQQGLEAAAQSSAGLESAQVLAAMLHYLEPKESTRSKPQ